MQEDTAAEPFCGYVVTSFFVHYDNDGNVHLVSNVKDDILNNFEISIDLIPNFVKGYKDCTKYKIDYFFNINAGLISDTEEQTDLIKTDYLLYQLKKEIINPDIIFEHDSINKLWTAAVMPKAIERLTIVPNVSFYVCKKDNPFFLIAEHTANSSDLMKGPVTFEFSSELEIDFSDLSVYTIKRFRDYCIKEKHVTQD